MKLCAITDRYRAARTGEEETALGQRLRTLVAGWIEGGVDLIQLREKDLNPPGLRSFAEEIFAGMDRRHSKLLVNLPASPEWLQGLVPLVDGVHLASRPGLIRRSSFQAGSAQPLTIDPLTIDPLTVEPGDVERVREIFRACGREAIVSLSCHSVEDVRAARKERADLVLFAPVFEKIMLAANEKQRRDKDPDGASGFGSGFDSGFGSGFGSSSMGQGLEALRSACEAAEGMPVFALGGVTETNASACIAAGASGVAGIRLFVGDGWRRLRGVADI